MGSFSLKPSCVCLSNPELTMPQRLADKIAFVTAAGQGIGRAICEACVAEGARVIATDLDVGKLANLSCVRREKLDVRSTAAVEALAQDVVKAFGPPDILVNCAGFVHHGSVLDCSESDWDFSFDLNVKSMHRTLRAFLPGMVARRRGSIVNISSAVSSIRAVAADFIRQGIRANAICPGTIETPSLDGRVEDLSKTTGKPIDTVRQDFIDRQPIGRLGTAAEVAALALFLASDEASYITGQIHLVDGGMAL